MMAINIKVDVLYVLSRCAARFQLYMCIHTCKPLDEPNLIIIIIYAVCSLASFHAGIYIIINEGSLYIMHNDIKPKYIDTTTRSAAS